MTMANENTVLELVDRILSNAAVHGANCLVVACPMCHVNLDETEGRRAATTRRSVLPVYYLSDLSDWRWDCARRTSPSTSIS